MLCKFLSLEIVVVAVVVAAVVVVAAEQFDCHDENFEPSYLVPSLAAAVAVVLPYDAAGAGEIVLVDGWLGSPESTLS